LLGSGHRHDAGTRVAYDLGTRKRGVDHVPLLIRPASVVSRYEDAPSMTEMLDSIAGLGFAPMLLSPIHHGPDGGAIEFDSLAVNARRS
jgi:hypothetical protein